jgi:endoglucanase
MQRLLLLLLSIVALSSEAQTVSQNIIVDQFGYLPDATKIAVVKNPQTGFDEANKYTPGDNYAVVNALTKETIFTGTPTPWKNGTTDASSGDKAWWFDFSSVTTIGKYYVLDVDQNKRSHEFQVSPAVYNEVLKQAVRTFFYQRAGFAKDEKYAGKEWADGASHIGDLQDKNCRLFNKKTDATTERDVSGGWYDAGDYNKYTRWTADYVMEMMYAYLENPSVWTDDYNIPESGNGIPDLLDEAKWGTDHLLRLQNEDGSVLSVVGVSHASPPSAAKGQSLYGPASTSATLNSAAAYAFASKVFAEIGMTEYAELLKQSAIKAWNWGLANPNVLFRNNESQNGSTGLAAGQQEVDDYGRFIAKLKAACFLYEITNDQVYKAFFVSNYKNANMFEWNYAFPFQSDVQDVVLYYTTIEGATPSVVNNIKTVYKNAMNGGENFPSFKNKLDPYRAYLKDYTWGSNATKSRQGSMFYNMISYEVDTNALADSRNAAMGYINYIHGVNPLNFVYLSNMYRFGAENGVNEFYHTWFANGSAKWDRVGKSTYGPAPGFITGGPNPSYNWDGCCPSGCGSAANNAICNSEPITPPKGQPKQKSYKDFNTSWPLNSWSVTENSCGYQISYIRLLSKFVNPDYDCNGDLNGTAFYDACNTCAGGNTGHDPETDLSKCTTPTGLGYLLHDEHLQLCINMGVVEVEAKHDLEYEFRLTDVLGRNLFNTDTSGNFSFNLNDFKKGIYIVSIHSDLGFKQLKVSNTNQ